MSHLADGIISIPCLPITTLASQFLSGWYSPLLLVSWHHYCHATSEGHLTMVNLNISTIDINGIFIFTPMQYKPTLRNLWAPPAISNSFLIYSQRTPNIGRCRRTRGRTPCCAIVYGVHPVFFFRLLVSLSFCLSTIESSTNIQGTWLAFQGPRG